MHKRFKRTLFLNLLCVWILSENASSHSCFRFYFILRKKQLLCTVFRQQKGLGVVIARLWVSNGHLHT